MNLKELLNLQWNSNEKMVKYCLTSSLYIQLNDKFVVVCSKKPKIDSDIWYDDETKSPSVTFESFVDNNTRNLPNYFQLENIRFGNHRSLFIAPQYYADKTDGKLCGLRYEDDNFTDGRKVSKEELEIINQAVSEVRADYEKRLKRYWKRYSDKVTTKGYWANR